MQQTSFGQLLRRLALPAGCAFLLLYFGGHAFFGETGLFALEGIAQERTTLEARNGKLKAERARLAHDIALLDPNGADPDYADELIRRQLGVVRPDEVVVPLAD